MAEVPSARCIGLALVVASGALYSARIIAQNAAPVPAAPAVSLMANPFVLTPKWPTLDAGMKWGAAIGIIPDQKSGTWMLFRSEPPIVHIDASGKIIKKFGAGKFWQAHGSPR